jgi:ABC-2 type transport system ATP-binding protein
MIETTGLTKIYKNLIAVKDLNLSIPSGEIFGFIGPNGAGKTTTIKMLSTLIQPTRGKAIVAGYDVVSQPDEVKRVIGYMPDSFGVYEDMKVWEYLDFFAAAYRIVKSKRAGIIDDVLRLTDLIDKKDDYVEALSKGMKQRLCLAKTLVHDPQVLLLDEPASGLDPRARIDLRELLKELRRMGKTILISSHILTELADFCTSIGIIERGTLLKSGAVNTILQELKGGKVVLVTLKTDHQRAVDLLSGHPQVRGLEVIDDTVHIKLDPECDDTAFIGAKLYGAGLPVQTIREEAVDLEDIFMKVTTGAVQ